MLPVLLAAALAAAPAAAGLGADRLAAHARAPDRLLEDGRVLCHLRAVVPEPALLALRAAYGQAAASGPAADGFWRFEGRWPGDPSSAVVELHPDGRARVTLHSAFASADQRDRAWPGAEQPPLDLAALAARCVAEEAEAARLAAERAGGERCDADAPFQGLATPLRATRLRRRDPGCAGPLARCLVPADAALTPGDLLEVTAPRDGVVCAKRERGRRSEAGWLPEVEVSAGPLEARAELPAHLWRGSWYRNTPAPREGFLELVAGPRGLLMLHAEARLGTSSALVVADPYRVEGGDATPDGETECPLVLHLFRDAVLVEDRAPRGCFPPGVTMAGVYYRNAK